MTPSSYPMTAATRAEARAVFDQHCDMNGIGYLTVEDVDGERVCFLYDAKGYCLIASRHGQYDLINYAIANGITIRSRH
ncbi:hypothetical protein M0654_03630 [Rhizobium sp. NTR19]|uniref:Uncharacterized protein n=1 Tax=Neorhizobium turbinariae TaxID=2937795 RepID=A0ABT0IMG1_9HYPH|nr:hypothetical protein [Neorhizobium turbinariae]MCK8779070.1 hypothetical protein [Neorhizobium turbinariae]